MLTLSRKPELIKELSSLIVPTIFIVGLSLLGLYTPFLLFHFFAEFSSIFFALCLGVIYLKRLPINKLKIDQSLICCLPDDGDDTEITNAC
ncbi:hypothetical protein GCM10007916_05360 [Psychromonas marina]|uniref:Uncharacterized protein n=1 Tax=Psychromonas marina TaxID=88364 RepID=A0ABQ6DWT9_9GAMM|nr:hypothetical protein GCM10007916_05360 [Psychromonas marina]